MRLIMTGLFGLLFCFTGNAQTKEVGSWNMAHVRFFLSKNISVFGEAQIRSLRFYTHYNYYEYKGGINYHVNPGLMVSLGVGDYDTYKEGGNFVVPKNNDEYRIWPQVVATQTVGKFRIEHRYRAERRVSDAGLRYRFRFRGGVMYPFGKAKNNVQPFMVGVSSELFLTNKEPFFERNRFFSGFSYRPNAMVTMQVGYINQFDYKLTSKKDHDYFFISVQFEIKDNGNSKPKEGQKTSYIPSMVGSM